MLAERVRVVAVPRIIIPLVGCTLRHLRTSSEPKEKAPCGGLSCCLKIQTYFLASFTASFTSPTAVRRRLSPCPFCLRSGAFRHRQTANGILYRAVGVVSGALKRSILCANSGCSVREVVTCRNNASHPWMLTVHLIVGNATTTPARQPKEKPPCRTLPPPPRVYTNIISWPSRRLSHLQRRCAPRLSPCPFCLRSGAWRRPSDRQRHPSLRLWLCRQRP